MKIAITLIILSLIVGCSSDNRVAKPKVISVENLGEIRFRKSYAGHEDWTDAQFDSTAKSNPGLDVLDTLTIEAFDFLQNDGLVVNQTLLVDKLSQTLQDSLHFIDSNKNITLVKIETGSSLKARVIVVSRENQKLKVSLTHYGTKKYKLKKIEIPDKGWHFLIFSQWYFMNGDMYSLQIFKLE